LSDNTNEFFSDAQSGWEISEDKYTSAGAGIRETIFSQGNGYLGIRGNFEEAPFETVGDSYDGTYINGFYESGTITYGETAYGYAEKSQTMLNVPNGKTISLYLENEAFSMDIGKTEQYKRTLSLKEGILTRELIWTSPCGKSALIRMQRLVSFNHRHIAAICYEVTPLNFNGLVTLESVIDGNVRNRVSNDDPRAASRITQDAMYTLFSTSEKDFSCIARKTKHSGLALCCGMSGVISTENPYQISAGKTGDCMKTTYTVKAACGEKIILNKLLCYVDSREFDEDQLVVQTRAMLTDAREIGFARLKDLQTQYLEHFWHVCDVEIRGDSALQQGIRYNMFQLLQSTGTDGKTNISSKGLSGEGYEGHYFWDTETYVLPFFLYTRPQISRKLLEYRYNTLDKARSRARELNHSRGALFPWRTINGEECSAYFPAGTAQYHIDADIAHAVQIYVEATDDEEFLRDYGAEILFETARLWADLGHFNPNKDNKFCINCVTGPDEYNALVNNNCYTNLMAAENFRFAAATAELLENKYPKHFSALCEKISLAKNEPAFWRKAADNIYIPYDDRLGIHLQDDSFLDKKSWDFQNTPKENYPLLLHYHPLVIYRYNVCKQADMVLALFLLSDFFSKEQKKRDYDFYEKITTHDSSLSTSAFCVMACELGYYQKAYEYFMSTARMDLDDYNGNTTDGIHTANMAGTWMCILFGYGGMRVSGGELRFSPFLQEGWEELRFRVTFRGSLLQVSIDGSSAEYRLLEGNGILIRHHDQSIALSRSDAVRRVEL
jgi:trehalose/maltose hydrolase-like predicted phosphorylase